MRIYCEHEHERAPSSGRAEASAMCQAQKTSHQGELAIEKATYVLSLETMSDTPNDDTDCTEPTKTPATGNEPVNRNMVKEIMMEVLSGLQESSRSSLATMTQLERRLAKRKYRMALGSLRV